jgi:hypothetical protein
MGKGTEGSSRIKELGEGMGMEMEMIMVMDMTTDRRTAVDEVIKVICPFRMGTDTAMEDTPSKTTLKVSPVALCRWLVMSWVSTMPTEESRTSTYLKRRMFLLETVEVNP